MRIDPFLIRSNEPFSSLVHNNLTPTGFGGKIIHQNELAICCSSDDYCHLGTLLSFKWRTKEGTQWTRYSMSTAHLGKGLPS